MWPRALVVFLLILCEVWFCSLVTVQCFLLVHQIPTYFAGKLKDCASLQFLKSKADLEYIEKRLKLDFINNIAENGSHAEMVTQL